MATRTAISKVRRAAARLTTEKRPAIPRAHPIMPTIPRPRVSIVTVPAQHGGPAHVWEEPRPGAGQADRKVDGFGRVAGLNALRERRSNRGSPTHRLPAGQDAKSIRQNLPVVFAKGPRRR